MDHLPPLLCSGRTRLLLKELLLPPGPARERAPEVVVTRAQTPTDREAVVEVYQE